MPARARASRFRASTPTRSLPAPGVYQTLARKRRQVDVLELDILVDLRPESCLPGRRRLGGPIDLGDFVE
eukprot:2307950-Pyramimonas_sp.AAC.1